MKLKKNVNRDPLGHTNDLECVVPDEDTCNSSKGWGRELTYLSFLKFQRGFVKFGKIQAPARQGGRSPLLSLGSATE